MSENTLRDLRRESAEAFEEMEKLDSGSMLYELYERLVTTNKMLQINEISELEAETVAAIKSRKDFIKRMIMHEQSEELNRMSQRYA